MQAIYPLSISFSKATAKVNQAHFLYQTTSTEMTFGSFFFWPICSQDNFSNHEYGLLQGKKNNPLVEEKTNTALGTQHPIFYPN